MSRSKKVAVPANAISRVIGRGGCNINAIREISGAHIEVEKQKKQQQQQQLTALVSPIPESSTLNPQSQPEAEKTHLLGFLRMVSIYKVP